MPPELIIALTIAFEAIGEPMAGKQMVATAIVNRAEERKLSAVDVCLQRKQFSCWNKGIDQAKIMKQIAKWEKECPREWEDCLLLGTQVHCGLFKPITGANHYFNPSKCSPKWADKMVGKLPVGNHIFGRPE
jgi:spore germination cell wall hydrolase CwlJ-like protein